MLFSVLPARKVRDNNLILFEFPKDVTDITTLVGNYSPPGLLIGCMNLHYQLILLSSQFSYDGLNLPNMNSLMKVLPVKHILQNFKCKFDDQFLLHYNASKGKV